MTFLDFLGFQGQNVYGFLGMLLLGVILFVLSCHFGIRDKNKLSIVTIILSGTCLIGLPALFI